LLFGRSGYECFRILQGADQSFTASPSLAADLTVASRMVMLLMKSFPVMG
jgi:hypothetical protein